MVSRSLIVAFLIFGSHLAADTPSKDYVELPYLVVEKPAVVRERNKILSKAREFLGTSYKFGNSNGIQTDCSGFTQQVFKEFGVSLPRSASEQARYGSEVDINDLQIGDLLFYRTYKKEPSHVAIYAGDGQIIHASYRNKKVQYDSIDKLYYKKRFIYAKRLGLDDQNISSE